MIIIRNKITWMITSVLCINFVFSQNNLVVIKPKINRKKIEFSLLNIGSSPFVFHNLHANFHKKSIYPKFSFLKNDTLVIDLSKRIQNYQLGHTMYDSIIIDGSKRMTELFLQSKSMFHFAVDLNGVFTVKWVKLIIEEEELIFNPSKNKLPRKQKHYEKESTNHHRKNKL